MAEKPLGMIPLSTAKFFIADGKAGRQFCLQIIDGVDDRSYFMQTDNGKVCFILFYFIFVYVILYRLYGTRSLWAQKKINLTRFFVFFLLSLHFIFF
jgi:hypothetical protein